jgi:hypothetical protein
MVGDWYRGYRYLREHEHRYLEVHSRWQSGALRPGLEEQGHDPR